MKNKKWLNYTVGILLTLIVLTAVAGAGFRAGMMQNVPFRQRPSFTHDINGAPQGMQGNINPRSSQGNNNEQGMQENFQGNVNPQGMQGNFQKGGMPQDFQRQAFNNNRGFDRRDGRFSFLSPVFWVLRLAVLGLLVWIGYKFVKKSGWRLSLSKASPTPSVHEAPVVETEEKKGTE